MKSLCKILALGALAAASLGLSAQTIPASSLDSGSRATVAITPMTSSQVTSIVNSGIAAGAIAIPNQGGASGSICGMGTSYLTADYSWGESGAFAYWAEAAFQCGSTLVRYSGGGGWRTRCPSGYNGVAQATMAYPGPQIILAYCMKI